MIVAPTVPALGGTDLFALWGSLPIHIEVSPLILAVFLALVGIFVAIVSVVLVYHWRRFPFEQETFKWAERIYVLGVLGMFAVAVLGILLASA